MNLVASNDSVYPTYTTPPEDVVKKILHVYDHGIEVLGKIPQLEPELFKNLFKNQKKFVKAPQRPPDKPAPPDPEKKKLPDENAWLWYAYKDIEAAIIKASAPLTEYVKTFKQFEDDEHKLNPDHYLKRIEDPDEGDPLDAQGLMADIERLRELQKELREKIPDSVTVSIFKVVTNDIWNKYNQKYETIIEKEKKLIAEAAISENFKLTAKFDQLNAEIMRPPTDIEDLMRIKDFINNSAVELGKLQQ
jgi:hypothetical protein